MAEKNIWTGPIVDAHHHFWDLEKHQYPWLMKDIMVPHRYGDYSAIKKTYLMSDYLDDIAGQNVVASIYCEAEYDPKAPLKETRYVHEVARDFGYPGAMVAQAWLDADDAASLLAEQAAYPLVRSVRHKPGGPSSPAEQGRSLMSSDKWLRGYCELEKYGLHFDLQANWWVLPEAAELAANFPRTLIIVNHTGVPGRSEEALRGWRANMEKLAARSNTAVKISGLCEANKPWTVENNRRIVKDVIGMFGAERCMLGSNFPVDGMVTTFATIFDGYRTILADLPQKEQGALFHETAERIYRPQRLQ